jgi:hypothetical protein
LRRISVKRQGDNMNNSLTLTFLLELNNIYSSIMSPQSQMQSPIRIDHFDHEVPHEMAKNDSRYSEASN